MSITRRMLLLSLCLVVLRLLWVLVVWVSLCRPMILLILCRCANRMASVLLWDGTVVLVALIQLIRLRMLIRV